MVMSVRLAPEIEQRLARLAAATGRPKAFYVRELIASGLSDLEDLYLAAAAMERIRNGDEQTHSARDVRKELGLDR